MAARALRALFSPVMKLGQAYNNTASKFPFTTGVLTTVVKTSAADIFAQTVVERREDIDWKRNGLFTFFGFAYLGCFQYYLYNDLFIRMCKPITAAVGHYGSAVVKTFIDQCIHHPLFYFPAFYALKGTVEGRPLSSSLDKYRHDLWENCKALWMVWVPAQLVNFSVIPLHLRIPFVAGVSFAWTVIISVMRGSLEAEDPAEVPIMIQHELHGALSPHDERWDHWDGSWRLFGVGVGDTSSSNTCSETAQEEAQQQQYSTMPLAVGVVHAETTQGSSSGGHATMMTGVGGSAAYAMEYGAGLVVGGPASMVLSVAGAPGGAQALAMASHVHIE